MQAGKLRHRVEIQKKTEGAADALGAPTYTWPTVAKRWASIEAMDGTEFVDAEAEKEESQARFKVTFRALSGLNSTQYRIAFGSRIFELTSVMNVDERGIEHRCMAVEVPGES